MKEITIKEFKKKWINFNIETGHTEIENASIVPKSEKAALFTVAGMHPLVPYLMGKIHPAGTRLTNSQRCIRTNDIESIGDDTHCTFFEMLGTWSLGDYFKEKAIKDSYAFLTRPDYLNLPKEKIAVTVFEGDENAPKDLESYEIWKSCGLDDSQIFFLGKEHNWWAMGETGPCGPDSEMFFVTDKECDKNCSPACDCGKYIEIGNNVFMQYVVENEGDKPKELPSQNVDRGMGLERVVMALNGFKNVYQLDVFRDAISLIKNYTDKKYLESEQTKKAFRVIVEHLRTATVILGDNNKTMPSNVGRGYILRRLIRRAVRFSREIDLSAEGLQKVVEYYIDFYKEDFPEFEQNRNFIIEELNLEIERFNKTLNAGIKEFEKVMTYIKNGVLPGKTAFRLYDTFGFPLEITKELAKEKDFKVDEKGYDEAFKKHQEASRGAEEVVFKGGLADHSYQTTKYHTATHLTLAALRQIFGEEVHQMGSNLTPERMRLDFNLDRKMTQEEIAKVEELVNEQIKKGVAVIKEEMGLEEAKNSGALGIFENKYADTVSVYTIGDFSKEICGGPHVSNTSELGKYKIEKEQSSSSGVRRIRAVLS
jgi:alanyl-tRNA synthetase